MNRKLTLFLATLGILAMAVAGCASTAAPEPAETPAPESEDSAKPVEQEAKTTTWTWVHMHPTTSEEYKSFERIANAVMAMTDGLEIELHPGNTVVPEQDELEAVHNGVVDAACNYHQYNQKFYKASSLFSSAVGGLTSTQALYWFENEGDELCAEMTSDLNVVYIGTEYIDVPEIWCHSKVPLESLSDLQGLKMRAIGEAAEILGNVGVATVHMAGAEVYEAAQRGVVDAFEWGSAQLNWRNNIQEVADYLYLSPSRAPRTGNGWWINRDSWDDVSPQIQQACIAASKTESLTLANRIGAEAGYLQNFRDYGTIVQPLPEEIETAFLEAAEEYYAEQSAADPFFAKVYGSIMAWKATCQNMNVS
ncbi:hypothetical protein ACFLUT_03135 [Chloroflexota bacterium]